jgi:hypothetical protein
MVSRSKRSRKEAEMLVLVVSSPGGGRISAKQVEEAWDRWSLEEALSWPVLSPALDRFANEYGVSAEKAVALLPPKAISRWDPAMATRMADEILDWAQENGHTLILRGEHVAAAFGVEEFGEAQEIEGVGVMSLPVIADDIEAYAAALTRLLDEWKEAALAEEHDVELTRLANGDVQIDDGDSTGTLNQPWAQRCFGILPENAGDVVNLVVRRAELVLVSTETRPDPEG